MSIPVSLIPETVAALIPRLASDKPGEVVATAAAIGRQLRKSGVDWHDLATALRGGAGAAAATLHTYADAVRWLLDREHELTGKERRFLRDMRGILSRFEPRPKQARWIVGLAERLGAEWAGPDPDEVGHG